MEIINVGKTKIAVIGQQEKLNDVNVVLDAMGNASYHECSRILVYKESLPDQFFDLKTGFAGEILQKFSNYQMKIAIVGDFSVYSSKALRDFIRESNRGSLVFFKADYEEGVAALS